MIKIREIKTFVEVCNKNVFYIIDWDKITKREDGNFDFLVYLKAEDKPVLYKQHLASAAYNAKYLSPDIQNEIIDIAGEEVLEVIV